MTSPSTAVIHPVPAPIAAMNRVLVDVAALSAVIGAFGMVAAAVGLGDHGAQVCQRIASGAVLLILGGYGIPAAIWALPVALRGELPPFRRWAAPAIYASALLPLLMTALLIPTFPVLIATLVGLFVATAVAYQILVHL